MQKELTLDWEMLWEMFLVLANFLVSVWEMLRVLAKSSVMLEA